MGIAFEQSDGLMVVAERGLQLAGAPDAGLVDAGAVGGVRDAAVAPLGT